MEGEGRACKGGACKGGVCKGGGVQRSVQGWGGARAKLGAGARARLGTRECPPLRACASPPPLHARVQGHCATCRDVTAGHPMGCGYANEGRCRANGLQGLLLRGAGLCK